MTTKAALLILQPDGSLQEAPLVGEYILLGRAEENDIVLPGQLISRRHACIRYAARSYILEDLNSHNGTTVNGQCLSTGSQRLHDGDCIELGGICRLYFVDSDATSTRPQPPAQGLWLDEDAQDVWVDGQRISPQVSPAQFCLLQLLVARPDRVCTRAEIMSAIWPSAVGGVSEDAIDGLIKRVRARLSEVPNGDRFLKNVRGRGLILRGNDTAH
jgi:DNA-binding response OmpR family regulator